MILGDQLSQSIPSLAAADKSRDVVLIAELWDEATYVRHHKKKIAFVFSAMRHFAAELRADGWRVDYHEYDAHSGLRSFSDVVADAIERREPVRIVVVEPGEHRLRHQFEGWTQRFELPVDILEDTRFVCTHDEFRTWASGRKSLRMEYFYREMRRKTGLLMDGDQPIGGKWNYDAENRKPAKADLFMPRPAQFSPDETT
ncbi:MAG: cryptochrome/photolyase family protein, partial [Pseudomonadota bacterium]